jgi:hypothetical protein
MVHKLKDIPSPSMGEGQGEDEEGASRDWALECKVFFLPCVLSDLCGKGFIGGKGSIDGNCSTG